MIDPQQLRLWRYYFLDLPMFSCGVRSPRIEKRLHRLFEHEMDFMKKGFLTLCGYSGKTPTESEIDTFIKKAFQVKIVRESDAYTSLRMSEKKLCNYFKIEGIENLRNATAKGRPVILLTGHIGSFFIPAIAFSHLGFNVYTLARSVDRSQATPRFSRIYQTLNYWLTARCVSAGYIFTDFAGKINRTIDSVLDKNGILWAAIDMPKTLYPHKHLPALFLGCRASFPSGLILRALKKNAIFMTAWNIIETQDNNYFTRKLKIDEPLPKETEATAILQGYADRMSQLIMEQPWQWLGLQVIDQYRINGGNSNE